MKIDFSKKEVNELLNALQNLYHHYSILKSRYEKNEYMSRDEKEKKAYKMQEKIDLVNKQIYKLEDALDSPFE